MIPMLTPNQAALPRCHPNAGARTINTITAIETRISANCSGSFRYQNNALCHRVARYKQSKLCALL